MLTSLRPIRNYIDPWLLPNNTMCLAVPGKIISIDDKNNQATIDYGNKTIRKANISLVEVSIGDYVLVHAGFAIQKVDPKEAKETLALFSEILSKEEE